MNGSHLQGIACSAIATLILYSNVYASTYTITDLGTLGSTFSYGKDINASGQVTGHSQVTEGSIYDHAFLYDGSGMQDLGTLGGDISRGRGINDSGQVTGESRVDGEIHAFLYDDSGMQDLGTLGGFHSIGWGINASGQVTGESHISLFSGAWHAFLYDDSGMQDLGTLGGSHSKGSSINDSGQVTGESRVTGDSARHAFLYDGSGMQDLGTLGGTNSYGSAINASGQVTGNSQVTGDSARHAFLYDGSGMQDLGTLGGTNSYAGDINASGHVVGGSNMADGRSRAFLYDGSGMKDLCVLVNCTSAGWDDLDSASAINDNGDITGIGSINGELHAFLVSRASVSVVDTDGDGIPNDYEAANGLDPNDPSDASLDNDDDGLTNLKEFQLGTALQDNDTDDDGLTDGWEVNGYVATGGHVDLAAMGANPLVKDIFVEVDYMFLGCNQRIIGACRPGNHAHQLPVDTIRDVVDSFSAHDIVLHVDGGHDFPMKPKVAGAIIPPADQWETWGSLSDAEPLSHDDVLKSFGTVFKSSKEFYAYKDSYFKRMSEDGKTSFRYAVSGHHSSGGFYGEAAGHGSRDFYLTMANLNTDLQRGLTFMHELGHTLGFQHGGDKETQYKPNYLSVMNYLFAYQGLITNGTIYDYSDKKLDTLDEDALDESIGLNIDPPPPAGTGTFYLCKSATSSGDKKLVPNPVTGETINGYIDWDCDEKVDPDTVTANINQDCAVGLLIKDCWEQDVFTEISLEGDLKGHDDWGSIDLPGNGSIGDALEAVGELELVVELPGDEYDTPYRPYSASVTMDKAILFAYQGEAVVAKVKITNIGLEEEIFSVKISASPGVSLNSNYIDPINLDSGGEATFDIGFSLTQSVVTGNNESVKVRVFSTTDPRFVDTATLNLIIIQSDDLDGDLINNNLDICPAHPNTNQKDSDTDGIGDLCDNCWAITNADQADFNNDGSGDVCSDSDDDGLLDSDDQCPLENGTGFDVDSNGCIDSFSGLSELISRLVSENVIQSTMENSLLSKIGNAEKLTGKEQVCAAIELLQAFKNQVHAQVDKKISIEAATKVIDYAGSIEKHTLEQLPAGESCH